ncbi:hypothetical protein ACFO26_09210 [Lactococcus nasutitermitis]|uniref:DUF2975 domain-containing protein n=1 Tax=Lactococcus nasutitermitis TaxID=1652957 RepID=A0ABV9JI65_9LACT|nr:hypothetical protein [Lactococcus nasutitermitis]
MEKKMSKPKLWAFIGAIIASVGVLISLISSAVSKPVIHKVYENAGIDSQSQSLAQSISNATLVISVIIGLIFLVLYWLAFVKMDKKSGYGWSIFLLVMGIFSAIGVLFALIGFASPNTRELFGTSIAYMIVDILGVILSAGKGVSFIMTFVAKHQEHSEQIED